MIQQNIISFHNGKMRLSILKEESLSKQRGLDFKIFPLKTISQVFSIKFRTIWLTSELKRLGETTLRSRDRGLWKTLITSHLKFAYKLDLNVSLLFVDLIFYSFNIVSDAFFCCSIYYVSQLTEVDGFCSEQAWKMFSNIFNLMPACLMPAEWKQP